MAPRKATPEPVVAVETITPAVAEELLNRNAINRAVRPTVVERFARIMQRGEWHLNGETVKVDLNGDLMDGQHRLMAVALANKPIAFIVVRNLPPAMRSSIDVGVRRTLPDWLKMQGEKEVINLATAINWYWRFTQVDDPAIRQQEFPTFDQGYALLQRTPGLRSTLREWRPRLGTVSGRGALLCALLYWFSEVDEVGAKDFAEKLWQGTDLSKGSAVLVLRRYLANDRQADRGKSSSLLVSAVTVKAFNNHRLDTKVMNLSWRPKMEKFPRPLTPEEVEEARAEAR